MASGAPPGRRTRPCHHRSRPLESTIQFTPELRDVYQELANVAMGQGADLLARLLDAFVLLPIPNVNVLEVSELHMALSAAAESDTLSAVCQGFIGAGIAGEALLLFHDASFQDLARLMNHQGYWITTPSWNC